jgi:DNA invertase Pin-like site-specific DNA recombinase
MTSMSTARRAAVYHRVSTLDQNPTLLRSELRAAVKRLGYRIVLDVEETGSGAQNDRPGFQRILRAARRGQLDALLVFKLDRAGRSPSTCSRTSASSSTFTACGSSSPPRALTSSPAATPSAASS